MAKKKPKNQETLKAGVIIEEENAQEKEKKRLLNIGKQYGNKKS